MFYTHNIGHVLKAYQPVIYKQQDNTENQVSSVSIGMSARWIQVVFLHKAHLSLQTQKTHILFGTC
jgi:hypothetical protein